MNTSAAPTANDARDSIETYERTDEKGRPELVFYDPGESGAWLTAPRSSAVKLEACR